MKQLSSENLNILRVNSILSGNEIAFESGDILIAEDVITKERRVIGSFIALERKVLCAKGPVFLKEDKQLLKG
jgi:hypothetical protein